MALFRFERRSATSTVSNPARWLTVMLGGGQTRSGEFVDAYTALQATPMWNGVVLLSQTIASLPLPVYRRLPNGGKERAREYPLYSLLHDRANPEMSSFTWRETSQGHLLIDGNAFSEIVYGNNGYPVELWPWRPDTVTVFRATSQIVTELTGIGRPLRVGELLYRVSVDGHDRTYPAERVLHLRWFSRNGVIGYSPVTLHKEAIGISLASQANAAAFFGNASRPAGILKVPAELGELDEDEIKRLRESWEAAHKGSDKAFRTAVLEGGVEWQQISLSPEAAQLLEQRRYQVIEVARILNIQPHLLKELERATFSNIEHQGIEFVVHTMRPWFVRWEQEINWRLIPPEDRAEYFAEFLADGLLRGDQKNRYEAYQIARLGGWISANEIRSLENMNPLPEGGDIVLQPMNYLPLGSDPLATRLESEDPSPDQNQKAQRSFVVSVEERSTRSARTRRRIQLGARSVFEAEVARIVRKEKAEVMRQAERLLSARSWEEMSEWLGRYYEDLRLFVVARMSPLYQALADQIYGEAAEEIDAPPEESEKVRQFVADYVEDYSVRHIRISRGRLRKVGGEAVLAGESPLTAIAQQLDHWEQERAQRVANEETNRFGNAVTQETYRVNGRRTMRWIAMGEEICPWCERLNGKIVSIGDPFVSAGEAFQPEGADGPMTPSINVKHPPLHGGCECQVVAVKE